MKLFRAFQLGNTQRGAKAIKLAAGDFFSGLVGIADVQAFPDAAARILAVRNLHGQLDIFASPSLRGLEGAVANDGLIVAGRQRFKAGLNLGFVCRNVKINDRHRLVPLGLVDCFCECIP